MQYSHIPLSNTYLIVNVWWIGIYCGFSVNRLTVFYERFRKFCPECNTIHQVCVWDILYVNITQATESCLELLGSPWAWEGTIPWPTSYVCLSVCHFCGYLCSTQSENLCNLEIVLRNLTLMHTCRNSLVVTYMYLKMTDNTRQKLADSFSEGTFQLGPEWMY